MEVYEVSLVRHNLSSFAKGFGVMLLLLALIQEETSENMSI